MSKRVTVFFANGFEEIEGLTVVDLLRRAKVEVEMVSIEDSLVVTGSHQITVTTDVLLKDMNKETDVLVLPGGMPGTRNLQKCEPLKDIILEKVKENIYLAAICAAPLVYGQLGLLKGKRATCYPGFEEELLEANTTLNPVEVDGHFITSRGLGTAVEFALTIIEVLLGKEESERIAKSIIKMQ